MKKSSIKTAKLDFAGCSSCGKHRAYPALTAPRLDPWMVDTGLHGWCNICLGNLTRQPIRLQAMYQKWLVDRAAAISSMEEGKYRRRGAGTVEKIVPDDVFDRDGWVCQLCKEPVDFRLDGRDRMGPSLDHIIPLSLGGEHTWANVQLAHRACNSRKGARLRKPAETAA